MLNRPELKVLYSEQDTPSALDKDLHKHHAQKEIRDVTAVHGYA